MEPRNETGTGIRLIFYLDDPVSLDVDGTSQTVARLVYHGTFHRISPHAPTNAACASSHPKRSPTLGLLDVPRLGSAMRRGTLEIESALVLIGVGSAVHYYRLTIDEGLERQGVAVRVPSAYSGPGMPASKIILTSPTPASLSMIR